MAAGPEGAFSLQGRGSSRKRPAWAGEPSKEERAAWWAWRVRRLTALKLAWFRTATRLDLPDDEKGRKLQANELAQRSEKAALWRATPDCTRWCGEGKHRFALEKDTDRHQAIIRLEAEAGELFAEMCRVFTARSRRRKGLKPLEDLPEIPEPTERHGPYDVDLDDLPGLLAMPMSQMVRHLEIKKLMTTPPRKFKPGQVPQAPAGQPPQQAPRPPAGQPAPGRPTPPKPVHQTLQGALQVEIPFGKYAGETLEQLVADDEGLSYLWWLANDAQIKSNRFAEAVAIVYDVYADEAEGARRGTNFY